MGYIILSCQLFAFKTLNISIYSILISIISFKVLVLSIVPHNKYIVLFYLLLRFTLILFDFHKSCVPLCGSISIYFTKGSGIYSTVCIDIR